MQPPKMANSPPPQVASAATAPSEKHGVEIYGGLFAGIAVVIVLLTIFALIRRRATKARKQRILEP